MWKHTPWGIVTEEGGSVVVIGGPWDLLVFET